MRLVQHLGPKYSLASVVTLKEIGLQKHPLTPAGKVQKNVLKELVATYSAAMTKDPDTSLPSDKPLASSSSLQNSNEPEVVTPLLSMKPDELEEPTGISQRLLNIWTELVGITPLIHDEIAHLADSITLLRYCDKVERTLGKKLYLQDLIAFNTIQKQARLLKSRDAPITTLRGGK